MLDLKVEHHFFPGLYAKRMVLAGGHYSETHKHNFDHLSILAAGVADVTVDGVTQRYTAGDAITIKADAVHTITAVSDIVWFCIHATTVTDPELIDYTLIKEN